MSLLKKSLFKRKCIPEVTRDPSLPFFHLGSVKVYDSGQAVPGASVKGHIKARFQNIMVTGKILTLTPTFPTFSSFTSCKNYLRAAIGRSFLPRTGSQGAGGPGKFLCNRFGRECESLNCADSEPHSAECSGHAVPTSTAEHCVGKNPPLEDPVSPKALQRTGAAKGKHQCRQPSL